MHPEKFYRFWLPDFIIIALFVCFLIFAASRQGLNFDAAYNMLSYQSLFDGNGFVYTYNGESIPFDPVISTGPELYLPAFVLWKIFGNVNYAYASYVLVFFYALFLIFFRAYVIPQQRHGWLILLFCLCLFMCNINFFEGSLLVAPLGEPLSALLLFVGLFLLFYNKIIVGFVLLGFALDTKTNVLIALLPCVALLLFNRYVLPLLREKQFGRAVVKTVVMLVLSGLMFVPYLTYTKIVPALVLDRQEYAELKAHQSWRSKHMVKNGFGQVLPVISNPGTEELLTFFRDTEYKFKLMLRFYGGSSLLPVVFFVSLAFFTLQAFKMKSFLLYVFAFSGIVSVWWVIFPVVGFYRYFAIADFLYLFGATGLLAAFLKQGRRVAAMTALVMLMLLYVPQFSFNAIEKSLDDTSLRQWHAMKQTLMNIDERQIFGLGWFQAPELMLMTHKRFQNYYDSEKLEKSKSEFDSVYLIATMAAIAFGDLSDEQYAGMQLVEDYGVARLYKIQ